nr:hypothetical protein [Actinomycetes bacterium]
MQVSPIVVAGYALIPVAAMALAATLSSARPVSRRVRSLLQHFAAGLVIAIVAVELLPQVRAAQPTAVVAGFALGVLAMLGIRRVGASLERRGEGSSRSSAPLLI